MPVFDVFQSRLDQIITTSTSNRSKMHSKSFFNKMHIFRHTFISILFALGQKKISLKSDQLEVGGSVYVKHNKTTSNFFLTKFYDCLNVCL